MFSSSSWKPIAEKKQRERAEIITKFRRQLNVTPEIDTEDEKFLEANAVEVARRIREGEWTSVAVVSAYIRQAIRVHTLTNCLTEIRFEEALKEAAQLDAEYSATKQTRGPFHGLPVTFKDMFQITGFDTTIGQTQWAFNPAQTEAQLVKQFRDAGAVIIAKTNVPQTMLSFECANPLYGRTLNPYSDKHTCGGSTGGEAVMLAANASTIGVGSDVGGSLRIPPGYCGVYGLKAGPLRLSKAGTVSGNPGFEAIKVCMGTLARSVEDLELSCRTLFGSSGPINDSIPSTPFKEATIPEKLRFGYYTSDGLVKASPACKRGVLETVEALKKQGHECIEFVPTLAGDLFTCFVGLISADGYSILTSNLGPDPLEESLALVTLGPRLPGILRTIACWIVNTFTGDRIFSRNFGQSRQKSAKEFIMLTQERDRLRKQWFDEVWVNQKFDAIITPVQAVPAVPHGATSDLSPLSAATIFYNVADSPVATIPVTRVDPAKDQVTEEWWNEPGHGSKILENFVYTRKKKAYDPVEMAGLPVGIQLVGKNWEEENLLAMARVVDDALGPRSFGTKAWKIEGDRLKKLEKAFAEKTGLSNGTA